jgi:hypothetical protein
MSLSTLHTASERGDSEAKDDTMNSVTLAELLSPTRNLDFHNDPPEAIGCGCLLTTQEFIGATHGLYGFDSHVEAAVKQDPHKS